MIEKDFCKYMYGQLDNAMSGGMKKSLSTIRSKLILSDHWLWSTGI